MRSFHPFREFWRDGLTFLDDQKLGESPIENPLRGRPKRFRLEILGQCQTDNEPPGFRHFRPHYRIHRTHRVRARGKLHIIACQLALAVGRDSQEDFAHPHEQIPKGLPLGCVQLVVNSLGQHSHSRLSSAVRWFLFRASKPLWQGGWFPLSAFYTRSGTASTQPVNLSSSTPCKRQSCNQLPPAGHFRSFRLSAVRLPNKPLAESGEGSQVE